MRKHVQNLDRTGIVQRQGASQLKPGGMLESAIKSRAAWRAWGRLPPLTSYAVESVINQVRATTILLTILGFRALLNPKTLTLNPKH